MDGSIRNFKGIRFKRVWQEPLSSLKQKKNKRLQAWEKQLFLTLQKDFVRALEQQDKTKARELLDKLGASSIAGGSLFTYESPAGVIADLKRRRF